MSMMSIWNFVMMKLIEIYDKNKIKKIIPMIAIPIGVILNIFLIIPKSNHFFCVIISEIRIC